MSVVAALLSARYAQPIHQQLPDIVERCIDRRVSPLSSVYRVMELRRREQHCSAGGYRIDGLDRVVAPWRVYPSQDGQVWAFYNGGFGPSALVRCLFIPWNF